MLTIAKVIEHISTRILCYSNSSGAVDENQSSSVYGSISEKSDVSETSFQKDKTDFSDKKIEVYCNDQLLNPAWNLRTVKHLVWKNTSDLVFYYLLC